MVSRTQDHIDFHKLESEVEAAVEADARYWRENDAKFRAVNQKVATYDEFKDIVLAAHLKPIDKEDRLDNIRFVQPWNQLVNKSKPQDQTARRDTGGEHTKEFSIPGSGAALAREWQRTCKTMDDRYTYLLWLGADMLAAMCRAEISQGLLGDFVTALEAKYHTPHCMAILDILHALTTANRFSLSVDFLSSNEKDACRRLFDRIFADLKQGYTAVTSDTMTDTTNTHMHTSENAPSRTTDNTRAITSSSCGSQPSLVPALSTGNPQGCSEQTSTSTQSTHTLTMDNLKRVEDIRLKFGINS